VEKGLGLPAHPAAQDELEPAAGGKKDLAWVQQAIAAQVHKEWREDFGVDDYALAVRIAESHIDLGDPAWRFDWLSSRAPGATRFLDLASGYGTAVFHGLAKGLEGFGVEPAPQKHALAAPLLRGLRLPEQWRKRNLRAMGENLPFRGGSFDAILSYQTLEHVSDPEAVLKEWVRVTSPGGGIHLRCPDYAGTYEGHYRLPWLPLLPRSLARLWLRLNRRPPTGLAGIGYVTAGRVERMVDRIQAGQPGLSLSVTDLEKDRVYRALRRRRWPAPPGWYAAYRLWHALKTCFRREKEIHFWIGVESKP